ncbi:hypothetical protein B0H14DRAFT_2376143, partial [Mycena olivaceomarginata]
DPEFTDKIRHIRDPKNRMAVVWAHCTIPPLELGHLRKKLKYVFSKSLWCLFEVIDF